MLSVLDRKWREHLYEMDYLKEGIGLRAMAQRDPLVEYQREGYNMWQTMLESMKEEAVRLVYNAEVAVPPKPEEQVAAAPQTAESLLANLPSAGGERAAEAPAEPEVAPSPLAAVAARAVGGAGAAADGAEPEVEIRAPGLRTAPRRERLHYSAPDEGGGVSERDVTALHGGRADLSEEEMSGVGLNEPCPCGSGKKFCRSSWRSRNTSPRRRCTRPPATSPSPAS